jgi:asparagine synthase (glutamine-hydrolysing)
MRITALTSCVEPARHLSSMCGIAGLLSLNGARPDWTRLAAMNDALSHRGPDGDGIEVLGPCGLAHRRLSIIDLSAAGKQPMSTIDGKLWLTYNGEVYNYLELRGELEQKGAEFRSHTDSEVILWAYRVWGLDCFARFNGMWGLGIWDVESQRLVLSRDRMGVKPLYFHKNADRVLFASEVKALLAAEPDLAQVDLASLAEFIERPVVGVGAPTYFLGIERFEPGTVMTIDVKGQLNSRRYWTFLPPEEALDLSLKGAADKVGELLTDSVRLRFRSDVPVGTCLSGGLDSSSIVAIAGKKLGKAPESFSAIYDDPGFEEGEFVRIMVRELGLTGHEISPDASDLPEVMERSTYYQEEPTAGPGLYSQWHVMRVASTRVKVLLDGQGGDELFAGYHPYFDTYVESLLNRARTLDVAAISELLKAGPEIAALTGKDPLKGRFEKVAKAYLRRARDFGLRGVRSQLKNVPALHDLLRTLRRHYAQDKRPSSPRALSLLSDHIRPGLEERSRPKKVTSDPLTNLLWDHTTRSSIPGLLHYEDRNSMAFSIEARVPFLDYRLVELAFQLPMHAKIQGSRTKVVLRESMKDVLPEAIRERKDKKGYPTPFTLWLKRTSHHDWARDLLFSERVRQRGFVDVRHVEQLWTQHLAGAADYSWRLWQLITLELFCRRYFDGRFAAETRSPKASTSSSHPVPRATADGKL